MNMGIRHKQSADAVRQEQNARNEALLSGRVPWCVWRMGMSLGLLSLNVITNAFGDGRSPELAAWLRDHANRCLYLADMAEKPAADA